MIALSPYQIHDVILCFLHEYVYVLTHSPNDVILQQFLFKWSVSSIEIDAVRWQREQVLG